MSRYLLAMDTATSRTSVALLNGGDLVVELSHDGATSHGAALPVLAAEIMERIPSGQLEYLAVGVGPGPFTGLRVGIAFARAMAWALSLPVVGVCTLDALARTHFAERPRCSPRAAPLLTSSGSFAHADFAVATDARRKEVYWAAYDADGERIGEPVVIRPSEIESGLRSLPTIGSGAALYPEAFLEIAEPHYPTGQAIGELALAKIESGEPLSTEPLYMRRPDAIPPARLSVGSQ